VLAELEVGLPEILTEIRTDGVDDIHAAKGQSEGRYLFLNLARASQERDVHHIPQPHDLCSPEDPFLSAFRQNDVPALRPGSAQ